MTQYLDISLITIPPSRQRREHDPDAHQALLASIETLGLLHPLILRQDADGAFILVAGERRLRALRDLAAFETPIRFNGEEVPPGVVPYTLFTELTPHAAREAELDENIRRKDLTWQERAAAEAELVALRADQNGGVPPTVDEIVEELAAATGKSRGREGVRREIALAAHLDNPAVRAARTPDEAFKIVKRQEQAARDAAVAKRLSGSTLVAGHRLVIGDSLAWVRGQDAGQFDVILTDPPYGMGADEFGDSGKAEATFGEHLYADGEAVWRDVVIPVLSQLWRITKPDAHTYIFCDLDRFAELRGELADWGWKVFRTPLIWYKPSAFRAPWPEHGPQRKYECVLYARKGDMRCVRLGGDVITCPPDDNLGHHAQKPIALYQDLLSRSARPGMRVLDPFAGTGPLFPAAHALHCTATCIEQDEVAAGIAAGRLEKLKETP